MWRFRSPAADFITAINRLEKTMGATADALAGLSQQLDKVADEVANSKQLDPEDLAAIEDLKAKIQRIDDVNPDAPAEEPTGGGEPGQPTE